MQVWLLGKTQLVPNYINNKSKEIRIMAESAVSFLLEQLTTLLRQEIDLLGGLREEAEYIKGALEHINAFLRVADAKEDSDPQLQVWVKQVREVAYDAEDVLDDFLIRFGRLRPDGFCGYVKKIYSSIKNLRARRRTASKMRRIRSRASTISKDYHRFCDIYDHVTLTPQSSISTSSLTNQMSWYDIRNDALLRDEADLVGFEEPKKKLMSWVLAGGSGGDTEQLRVHSVVGMGGQGKTTLVKKVYDDPQVKTRFLHRAWLTVSASFHVNELLIDMIRQFLSETGGQNSLPQQLEDTKSTSTVMLMEYINHFLQHKSYILVVDDVWRINAWEGIKAALPRNNCGSRVLITTRFHQIGRSAVAETGGHVYYLQPLPQEESWILFCRKAFPGHQCPSHLLQISQLILKSCQGLPLAITVIGSALATKNDSLEEWNLFHGSIRAELEEDEKLVSMNKLLSLSFFDLPYYLKTCLLYLSTFPEDVEIEKMRLIRLWAAEGFIIEVEGKTIEEVGEAYLNELVNRSLIQVAETGIDGRTLRTCRIHDIIRQIILSRSARQNVAVIGSEDVTRWPDNVRRLAIHKLVNNNITQERGNLKHLRSLLLFGSEHLLSESFLADLIRKSSRLLKVLDLRGAQLDMIPDEVFTLYHLTYLSLRRTKVKVVPKSIGRLQNLETLDLKHTRVVELPPEILELQRLRHLLVYDYGTFQAHVIFGLIQSFKAPSKIGQLKRLQKLCYIDAEGIVREVGKLTQLRKLGIAKLRREDGKELCSSLGKLMDLRSLCITSTQEDEVIDLQYPLSSSPQFLRTLYMEGRLEKVPQWITSFHGLTKVMLWWSRLPGDDDPLLYLQDLPNLVQLGLNQAFNGETLLFKAGGFLKLKILYIFELQELKCVKVEEDGLPFLEKLVISNCKLMEEVPSGIEHLKNLRFVRFNDMSDTFLMRLKNRDRETGDHWKIAHVSQVYIAHFIDGKWSFLYDLQ